MPISAREAAYRALAHYRKNGVWTDDALSSVLNKEMLDGREAALASRIFYGVVQNLALCDYYISCFSSVKLNKIEPQVLDVLRLSVYQIVLLSKIPVSAAVSEGVKLARKHSNPRATGFVNALLRKIAANKQSLPEVKADSDSARLSILYSHPEWLVQSFIDRLGIDSAEALLKANNEPVGLTVCVNTLKVTVPEAMASLESDNAHVTAHPWLENSLEVTNAHQISRLKAFKNGWIYVQDAAAVCAVSAAQPKPGQFVLDGCASPGGKSFTTAVMMGDDGRIRSCDVSEAKIRRLEEGANRLGIRSIETCVRDARETDQTLKNACDIVIADVPCSGFGVIRKKPEICYKSRQDIAGLPELQGQILSHLSEAVKPGGVLLYATCTLLRAENEDVIESFLKTHDQFSTEPFELPGPIGTAVSGMLTLWPHLHGTDGFFICKLRRQS